jgi:hypothetical protein
MAFYDKNCKTGGKWSYGGKKSIYGVLFEFDVLLRKCYIVRETSSSIPDGYDSFYSDGFKNPEYCLRDANHVLIRKVILIT